MDGLMISWPTLLGGLLVVLAVWYLLARGLRKLQHAAVQHVAARFAQEVPRFTGGRFTPAQTALIGLSMALLLVELKVNPKDVLEDDTKFQALMLMAMKLLTHDDTPARSHMPVHTVVASSTAVVE